MKHISELLKVWLQNHHHRLLGSIFAFCIFLASTLSAQADTNPFEGYKLPYTLPATIGSTTYTHVFGKKHTGTNDWWIVYHNEDNFAYTSSGFNPSSTDNACFYVTNITTTSYHMASNASCSGVPSFGVGNCLYKQFSDYTIFNGSGSLTLRQTIDCLGDATDVSFGSAVFPRIALGGTNGVDIVSTVAPATLQIISGQPTSDYVDVPDPITDPLGFVTALLTNTAIWLKGLIIPPDGFFSDAYMQVKTEADTKFVFYSQLTSAFTIPAGTTMVPITLGALHAGGQTIAAQPFISSFDADTFAPFRNFLSMVMYVSLGFWLIRKTSTIFSS